MSDRTDLGILILRIGIGLNMMVMSGWGKVTGGEAMLRMVGGSLPSFGWSEMPLVWGCLAAFAEFFCSGFLILGVFFRFSLLMLGFTMSVAVSVHLGMPAGSEHAGWHGASSALTYLAVYLPLLITGPGKHVITLKK